ncbi:MAG: AI-2E family transporter [Clostridium butyricum]|nr:AI-2E family transporter [Clostridium butyricum]
MNIGRNNKYFDIFILAIIGIVAYKIIDNYLYFFEIIGKFLSIISPFVYALICAYILNPIVVLFENKFKFKRPISITVTYLLISGIIFIVLFFTMPSLINSAINMSAEIPVYIEKMQECLDAIFKNLNLNDLILKTDIIEKIEYIITQASNFVIVLLQNSISSLLSITTNIVKIVLGFLVAIYVLMDKEKLLSGTRTLIYMILKERNGNIFINVVTTYHKMIGRYIGIKAIDSLIIGVIALGGLLIIDAPYAPLIAVVVGVTNMIPYFGPLIGEIVGAVITVFVSPIKAIIVFLLLLTIQQFDAWYLDPKLIGKKVGVSPLGIIFAVVVAGGFFGAIGMLLASPTMATINIYYSRMTSNFKNKNPNLFKKAK